MTTLEVPRRRLHANMPAMRALFLVAAMFGSTAHAGAAVLLFPSLGTPAQLTVSGRVLKEAPSKGSSTLSKNVRALASSNWAGAMVEVRYADHSAQVRCDHDGNFRVTFRATERPFQVGFGTAEAKVVGGEVALALVDIVAPAAPFFVVSDFDDTLAVTNVVSKPALFKAALMQDETDQPVVPGMAAFYRCLQGDQPARPGFALVSGSPIQYLQRVSQFLKRHGFPAFGIYLRDLGPSTLSNYKQPVIRSLLGELPHPVVFVGDSGERDPEIYRQMRAEFPDRVKAIYIRAAGRTEDSTRFEDMLLFSQPQEAALDAVKKGLANAECVTSAFPVSPAKIEEKK